MHEEDVVKLIYKAIEIGRKIERERTLTWVENNRTDLGFGIYRDHFKSENLVDFIKDGEHK
jgi:hypothetical protein